MKVPMTAGAVGALAVAGAVAAVTLTTGGTHAGVPTKVNLVSATSAMTSADQVALNYAAQTYPGAGTASVLKTEADTEHGVPVYDVTVMAPNGTTYSLSIRASNDSVLSAHPVESQPAPRTSAIAPLPTTGSVDVQTPEPTASPGATDVKQTPEPAQSPEPAQTPKPASADSPDATGSQTSQPSSQSSTDQQQKTQSGSDG